MLSQTAEYALRAVVWLAAQDGQAQTTAQIAEATQVPAGYLAKVLQTLGRAKLVTAQRGLGGGFSLARDPATVTALDVVEAVDPIPRIINCPLGFESHRGCLCPLHQRLDRVIEVTVQALGASTIAEIVAEQGQSKPFCTPQAEPAAATRSLRRRKR
jgi:Rrf2 family transcriptional regulator, nitric oxide-sensitive transcriptional repressor